MNVEKLMKLADFLRELDESKFDFTVEVAEHENSCGTVCCAIGWTPVVFPDEVEWSIDDMRCNYFRLVETEQLVSYARVAERLFGCHVDEMACLFYRGDQAYIEDWGDFPVCGSDATPNEVADAIEHYIKIRS